MVGSKLKRSLIAALQRVEVPVLGVRVGRAVLVDDRPAASPRTGRAAARAAGSSTSRPRRPGDRACRSDPRRRRSYRDRRRTAGRSPSAGRPAAASTFDDRRSRRAIRVGGARASVSASHMRASTGRTDLRQASRPCACPTRSAPAMSADGLALLLLFLGRLGRVAPLEHLPAQRVDRLALLVHDVVVLEQVLADVEVVALDLLLRVLDGAVDRGRARSARPPPCPGAPSGR